MTPSTIVSTFPHLFAAQRSVFLKGAVGVGKSSVIHALGTKLGVEVRDTIRASQMDPTDIKGFPAPNLADGTMRWLAPNFLPPMQIKGKGGKMVPNDSKGILFLDELTSGSVAVQAACYQLMLDRKVGEYILPDGWAIVAYLRFRPTMLHNFQPDSKEAAFPSPRTWAFADDIHKMPIDTGAKLELLKGTVGEAAAAEYLSFIDMASQLPSADHIAMDPKKAPVPESPGAQYAITTMLSVGTKDAADFRTFMQYMERMSVEFQVVYVRDLLNGRTVPIEATKEYTSWALKNQDVIKGS